MREIFWLQNLKMRKVNMENMDKLYVGQKYKNFQFFHEKYNKKVFFAFNMRLLLLKKKSK